MSKLALSLCFTLALAACGGSHPHVASSGPAATTAKGTPTAPKKFEAPTAKKHEVPSDWERKVDDVKGFAFWVPKGTEGHAEKKGGKDVYVAVTPKPHEIWVHVVAYKDASKTKDDLFKEVHDIYETYGDTDIKLGTRTDFNNDYSLAEVTSKNGGQAWKTKALVALDVTDNYIMMVGVPAGEFAANEDTIDTIWSSFEMFSGGASGESK